MKKGSVDQRILALCDQITAKRPRAVIDRILSHGFVTTEDLQEMGYDHPPRAARDVRENGVPLETFKVTSARTGRQIAAYRFADPSEIKHGRIGGRRAFSKAFKEALVDRYRSADTITGERMDARYLQIDHRIPYEVAGDSALADESVDAFMLLDASNQRAKSWSCEHCRNWQELHDPAICRGCFWAFPEGYDHIAMEPIRRVDVIWRDGEVQDYRRIAKLADSRGVTIATLIKESLRQLGEQ
jgi:hypothetical protein